MTTAELLARVRSAAGNQTIYKMGGGTLDPRTPSPRDEQGCCDCSAFVCWALELAKYQPGLAWLAKVNGGWLNTDGIWWDATRERTGFFDQLERPAVGCVLVYPSKRVSGWPGPPVGHIGIVTALDAEGRASRVIHCSSGNYRKGKDAIAETGPEVFSAVGSTVAAWCATAERPAADRKEAA